ncbi:hypothetical protein [[Phormidium] sp. ETS-05]|uniref:hypothetical protein n=1 Tax=[Phormidium] sp. ETS-05 TaxID=222819 RepID=UPI0018EEFE5A|nr:hypothetical protein [[Phormidium] sp. ETS-05]
MGFCILTEILLETRFLWEERSPLIADTLSPRLRNLLSEFLHPHRDFVINTVSQFQLPSIKTLVGWYDKINQVKRF